MMALCCTGGGRDWHLLCWDGRLVGWEGCEGWEGGEGGEQVEPPCSLSTAQAVTVTNPAPRPSHPGADSFSRTRPEMEIIHEIFL